MFLPPEPEPQNGTLLYLFSSATQVKWPMSNSSASDVEKQPWCCLLQKEKILVIRNRSLANIATMPILLCLYLFSLCIHSGAQTTSAFPDPQIKAALSEISAGMIQADVEKLVSFQTRSTLSAQDAKSIAEGKGIGAAREWIKSEFERYSRDCGGCLEVKLDSFTQPVSDRVASPVQLTNVYAVLKAMTPEN